MEDFDYEQIIPVDVVEESRGKAYHFYIVDRIGSPREFLKLIHTLKACGPSDLVYLHINTAGGDLYTTIQILQAMGQCRGTVIACAEGAVHSAGSLMFFAANAFEVGEFSSFMLHDAVGGTGGSMTEQEDSITHHRELYGNVCRKVYGPYITKAEMKEILKGGTVWLRPQQVNGRIEEALKKKAKKK